MQATKAELLDNKIEAQNKLLKSQLVIMKNLDARFEAIKELLVSKGIITEDEYQTTVDSKLGLRAKMGDEKIAIGDIVWVKYVATQGEEILTEPGLPLRIGSNAVPIEKELLDKPCDLKDHKFSLEVNNIEYKFVLDVIRVKTKKGENGILDAIES